MQPRWRRQFASGSFSVRYFHFTVFFHLDTPYVAFLAAKEGAGKGPLAASWLPVTLGASLPPSEPECPHLSKGVHGKLPALRGHMPRSNVIIPVGMPCPL